MKVSLDSIKELRKKTLASLADCRKALEESKGDIPKAVEFLRKRGLEIAARRQESGTKEGRIEAYVHTGNKIGVLLEIGCETDFVARNSEFAQFAKDVAMQITAANPLYIKKDDVPKELLKQEKDKEKFYKEACLLEQVFIKDPTISINDYLGSTIAKLGENISIRKFVRYKIG